MRAWSGRLVRLRRTRVPSGVASSADRARARRRQRFFFTFREQQRVATRDTCVLRFRETQLLGLSPFRMPRQRSSVSSLSPRTGCSLRKARGHRESFVQSTSFFSVFSRRTLFSLVRVFLRRSFSRRDIGASPRMPPQSRVSAQVVRNIFGRGDSEAGRSVVRALRLIRHALVLLPTLIGAGDTAGGRWL